MKSILLVVVYFFCVHLQAAPIEHQVIVVGGGLSGLSALHQLEKQGIDVQLMEVSQDIGGRVGASYNDFGTGLVVNRGAELMDKNHFQIAALIQELGLTIKDRYKDNVKPAGVYFFNQKIYLEKDLMAEIFRTSSSALKKLYKDQVAIGNTNRTRLASHFALTPRAEELDHITIDRYLNQVGVAGIFRQFVHAGIYSENGVDLGNISALVFFEHFLIDLNKSWVTFLPGHDESRYVQGGTHMLPDKLAEKYKDDIHLGRRLLSVEQQVDGKALLTFKEGDQTQEYLASKVIVTIPPPHIFDVTWKLADVINPQIQKIQYANNSKLILYFNKTMWENVPIIGELKSGFTFQAWDENVGDPNPNGCLIVYSGLMDKYRDHLPALIEELLLQMEVRYPGIKSHYIGHDLFEWPNSYAGVDRPMDRQKQLLSKSVFGPVHFAGEAWSLEYQGYMNGAVETGQVAAAQVLSSH